MHSLPDSNRMNVLSLPIKVGMWWRGLLCQPWPASISLVWLCGGGASQGVRCPFYLHSLFRAKSCMRPVGGRGRGGHDISQSTKPLPLSSEEHNRAKLLSIQHCPTADSGGKYFGCRMLPRPSYWARCSTRPPNFDKWLMIAVIHAVILWSTCHTTWSWLPAAKSGNMRLF